MESSNTNHEDKDNKGNINIPLATSALECKMLEYIAAQTQVLQAMAQTMVKIHSPLQSKLHSLKPTILSPMTTIKT
jgi:N-acetyl-anhydromuramyl-L-alanine amidase AmpD